MGRGAVRRESRMGVVSGGRVLLGGVGGGVAAHVDVGTGGSSYRGVGGVLDRDWYFWEESRSQLVLML